MGFIKGNSGGSGIKFNFLDPVALFADIATTYPNPKPNDSTFTLDTGVRYLYNGQDWVNIGQVTIDNGQIVGDYTIVYNSVHNSLDFKYIGV